MSRFEELLTPEEQRQFENIVGAIGVSGILEHLAHRTEAASDLWSKNDRLHPNIRTRAPVLSSKWKEVAAQLLVLSEKSEAAETYFYR